MGCLSYDPFKIFDKLDQPVMIHIFSHKINKKKPEHNLLFCFFNTKEGEKIKIKTLKYKSLIIYKLLQCYGIKCEVKLIE